MHVAVRPYLIAGVAAVGAGAIAITPAVVAPQAVHLPTLHAPVALAAMPTPIDTLVGLFNAGVGIAASLNGGALGSASTGNTLYAADAVFVANEVGAILQGFISDPSTIPPFIIGLPTFVEGLTELLEQQTTGVVATGGPIIVPNPAPPPVTFTAYQLPGEPAATTRVPVYGVSPSLWPSSPTVVKPFRTGAIAAATIADTVAGQVGLPKVAVPITKGVQAIGTSFIQAQGLVRSATVGAVQGTINAVAYGGDVPNAIKTGLDGVKKSVVGDPTVPKVSATGVVTGVPALDTHEPAKRLGAIKTVTTTVKKAVNDVAAAA